MVLAQRLMEGALWLWNELLLFEEDSHHRPLWKKSPSCSPLGYLGCSIWGSEQHLSTPFATFLLVSPFMILDGNVEESGVFWNSPSPDWAEDLQCCPGIEWILTLNPAVWTLPCPCCFLSHISFLMAPSPLPAAWAAFASFSFCVPPLWAVTRVIRPNFRQKTLMHACILVTSSFLNSTLTFLKNYINVYCHFYIPVECL